MSGLRAMVFTLLACSLSAATLADAPDAKAIADVSVQWAKAWSAGDLEAAVALYAEDAVFLPSTGTRVAGRTAIRELFKQALVSHRSNLRVQSKVTEQSGDLAYDSGEFQDGADRGSYLVILRRNADNGWLIVQHMWTDVPAPAP